jgi:hypothetical protein
LQRLQLCDPDSSWSSVRVGASERLHVALGGSRVGVLFVSSAAWTRDEMVFVVHRYTQTI